SVWKLFKVKGVKKLKIDPVISTFRRKADQNIKRTGTKNTRAATKYPTYVSRRPRCALFVLLSIGHSLPHHCEHRCDDDDEEEKGNLECGRITRVLINKSCAIAVDV